MIKQYKSIWYVAAWIMLTSGSVHASDIMLRHSAQCIQAFSQAEQQYGIPKYLLMAVANTESGRYHKGLKRLIPWPWTTNIAGKGAYHDSIHDAMTQVRRAQQTGTQSIDVGCMQINLKHHPDAFTNLMDAFNPVKNVNYAASFLRRNYDELHSWPKAIAAYHSRSPSRGYGYYAKVKDRWRDVRMAAGGKPLERSDYAFAQADMDNNNVTMQQGVIKVYGRAAPAPKAQNSTFKLAMREEGSRQRVVNNLGIANTGKASYAIHSGEPRNAMKVITVAARVTKPQDSVVMAPASKEASAKQQTAKIQDKPLPYVQQPVKPVSYAVASLLPNQPATSRQTDNSAVPPVVHLASADAPTPVATKTKGPRFIFTD